MRPHDCKADRVVNSSQAHVLVVDDEAAIRDMIQFALRRAGMDVSGAADAKDAFDHARDVYRKIIETHADND